MNLPADGTEYVSWLNLDAVTASVQQFSKAGIKLYIEKLEHQVGAAGPDALINEWLGTLSVDELRVLAREEESPERVHLEREYERYRHVAAVDCHGAVTIRRTLSSGVELQVAALMPSAEPPLCGDPTGGRA